MSVGRRVICHIGVRRRHIAVRPHGSNDGLRRPKRAPKSLQLQGVPLHLRGCIVVLEPDELIRDLLERWLGSAGYQVVPVVKDHVVPGVNPQLVIADISDPASAGSTIEALRSVYAAPILALSARFRRGLGASTEPARRLRVEKLLPKPFTRQQLMRAVRETLKQT